MQQNAPGLEVLGSNYPPPPMSLLVARLIGGAQFFVIGVALAGDKLLSPAEHPWHPAQQGERLRSRLVPGQHGAPELDGNRRVRGA